MFRAPTTPSPRSWRSSRGGISAGDGGRTPSRDAGGGRGRPWGLDPEDSSWTPPSGVAATRG